MLYNKNRNITLENLKDGLKRKNENRVDSHRFTKKGSKSFVCLKQTNKKPTSLYNCIGLCGSQYNLAYFLCLPKHSSSYWTYRKNINI